MGEEGETGAAVVVMIDMKVVLFVVRILPWGVIIVELRMRGAVVEMRVELFGDRVVFGEVIIVEYRMMGGVLVLER